MKHILLLLVLVWGYPAIAWEFRPASLDKLSLDASRFGCNRDPMTPGIPCTDYKGRIQLNWDVGLLNDILKWENQIHTEGTDAKLMAVGWQYRLVLPMPGGLELFMSHHSRHTMDHAQPTIAGRDKPERYPVEDAVGLRVIFYQRK
jgi:hypothetical protein